ncbi:MAG: anti-sigma factor family protein [Paracoccaceae bacterium]
MSAYRPISDDELTAYLDGEASADMVRDIDEQLEHDTKLQQQLAELNFDKAQLREAFATQQEAAPPMPSLPSPRSNTPARVMPYITGLAAGVVLAITVNWAVTPTPWAKWQRYAAAYQALYVTQTLSWIEPDAGQINAQLAKLGHKFALDLGPVTDVDGLDFRRGQTLGFDGAPLAQLAFLTVDGTPIAFCILREDGQNGSTSMRVGSVEGLAAAEWSRDGYGFLLVGGQDQELIERAAKTLAETI